MGVNRVVRKLRVECIEYQRRGTLCFSVLLLLIQTLRAQAHPAIGIQSQPRPQIHSYSGSCPSVFASIVSFSVIPCIEQSFLGYQQTASDNCDTVLPRVP